MRAWPETAARAPALVALGCGGTVFASALGALRMEQAGLPSWPAAELLITVSAAVLCAAWAARRGRSQRMRLLAGAVLVVTTVVAVAAAALLPLHAAAHGLAGVGLALPLVALGACCGAIASGHRAFPAGAAAMLAIGVWLGSSWLALQPAPESTFGLGAGALVLVLAAAFVPGASWGPVAQRPGSSAAMASGAAFGALAAAAGGCSSIASANGGPWPATAMLVSGLLVGFGCQGVGLRWLPAAATLPLGALCAVAWQPGAGLLGAAASGAALGAVACHGPATPWLLGLLPGVATVALAPGLGLELAAVLPLLLGIALAQRRGESSLLLAAAFVLWSSAGCRLAVPAEAPAVAGARVLARQGEAAAVYRDAQQSLELQWCGKARDVAGPDHGHGLLAVALLHCLWPDADRIGVVGTGTGRIPIALRELGTAELRCVEPLPQALALQCHLLADGPVPAAIPPKPHGEGAATWTGGTARYLWAWHRGGLDAAVAGEPLLVSNARSTAVLHRAMRHAVGEGGVVQPFLLACTPPRLLAAAFEAACAVHPWCGVFLAGDAGAIVGAGAPPDLDAAGRALAATGPAQRFRLHEAGICGALDLHHALLGTIRRGAVPAGSGADLQPDRGAAVAVLREVIVPASATASARLRLYDPSPEVAAAAMVELASAVAAAPQSVLLRRELLAAHVRSASTAIAALDPGDPTQIARAASIAASVAAVGAPSALLQAALGLPDRRGDRMLEPGLAGARALAIDPGLAGAAPKIVADVLRGQTAFSPLADLHRLPPPHELAALAVGDSPLAVALRVRFSSRCAAALVEVWSRQPLSREGVAALRELADPFVLEAAGAALAARGAERQLLQLWRSDLPLVPHIAALASADAPAREALALALGGRRDGAALELLARLLVDEAGSVRTAAGTALFHTAGQRIVYDPEWPRHRLQIAAEQLRSLHNP